jgi:exopolysaccharide production protein ExoQ
MINAIATLACVLFVVHLFRRDALAHPQAPWALWVPLVWMFLAGSRWASSWLNLSPPLDSADAYSEGSPVDRAVFFSLIVAGVLVLARRQIDWGDLVGRNKLLALYLVYCLLSVAWSDEPFVAFKRWFKDLGNPIMVLVVMTTPNPLQSMTLLLRRLSYLFLPLSLLFVRYFPDLGRSYRVDGSPMYTGIGHQKNDLGLMCLVAGIYFLWQVLQDREGLRSWTRTDRVGLWLLVAMLAWLQYMSNSQTSLTCLVIAAMLMMAARLPYVRAQPSRLMALAVTGVGSYLVLDAIFDIKNWVLQALGRDPSLTNRTDLWRLLFSIDISPVVGAGFMSFWSGDRMERIWRDLGSGVNQAHSGYIEQYLNLGYVGVAFMVSLFVVALLNARAQLRTQPEMAILRMCFVFAAALYNYTEASFYGINNMWVLTLLALINVPPLPATRISGEPSSPRADGDEPTAQRRRPVLRPDGRLQTPEGEPRWPGSH